MYGFVYWVMDSLPVATPLSEHDYPSSSSNVFSARGRATSCTPSSSRLVFRLAWSCTSHHRCYEFLYGIALSCPEEHFTALLPPHPLAPRSSCALLGAVPWPLGRESDIDVLIRAAHSKASYFQLFDQLMNLCTITHCEETEAKRNGNLWNVYSNF